MLLGLSTLFCLGEPFSAALKRLDKISVDHIEVVDEGLHALNSRRISMLKKAVLERDISLSVHAPFADINIASTSPTIRYAIMKRLKKSIKLSAQLDPECWVFHPGIRSAISSSLRNLDWEINLKSTRELLREAERHGLKIAIENVPEPFPFLLKRVEEFESFYKALGIDGLNLGITFDVGHANINGQINEFIERIGNKVVNIHVHDNYGGSDSHLGIGFGNINWVEVINVIKKINYKGALVIESMNNVEESIRALRRLISE
ncbi:MAG: sugar phosphate isomerase/epimerase [Candidatus Bathyarchaeota archaeon]|nr:sugar phosphate isomerase/epimerase [Candidatus Bathyarchaeota archaeon]